MTRREKQLENELLSMTKLCGYQLVKIKRLQAKIARLEKQISKVKCTRSMV